MRIVHDEASITYEREMGKYRVVHWSGPARSLPRAARQAAAVPGDPPQYDPAWLASVGSVSVRSLEAYEEVAQ